MLDVKVALVTAPDRETALKLALSLVEEGVIACANVMDGVTSIYRWGGALHRDEECLLILKVHATRVSDLLRRVPELHPHSVPEVLVVDLSEGHLPYLEWVAETAAPSRKA